MNLPRVGLVIVLRRWGQQAAGALNTFHNSVETVSCVHIADIRRIRLAFPPGPNHGGVKPYVLAFNVARIDNTITQVHGCSHHSGMIDAIFASFSIVVDLRKPRLTTSCIESTTNCASAGSSRQLPANRKGR